MYWVPFLNHRFGTKFSIQFQQGEKFRESTPWHKLTYQSTRHDPDI
jgi:hypothetical protein